MAQRKRVSRACDQCRRRKAKCDGRDGCGACERLDLECSFGNAIKQLRGPAYVAHLERQVQDLQAKLSKPPSPPNDAPDSAIDLSEGEPPTPWLKMETSRDSKGVASAEQVYRMDVNPSSSEAADETITSPEDIDEFYPTLEELWQADPSFLMDEELVYNATTAADLERLAQMHRPDTFVANREPGLTDSRGMGPGGLSPTLFVNPHLFPFGQPLKDAPAFQRVPQMRSAYVGAFGRTTTKPRSPPQVQESQTQQAQVTPRERTLIPALHLNTSNQVISDNDTSSQPSPPLPPKRRSKKKTAQPDNAPNKSRTAAYRERNRLAAAKCRTRKNHATDKLYSEARKLETQNSTLVNELLDLRDQYSQLRESALQHGIKPSEVCECGAIHQYNIKKMQEMMVEECA